MFEHPIHPCGCTLCLLSLWLLVGCATSHPPVTLDSLPGEATAESSDIEQPLASWSAEIDASTVRQVALEVPIVDEPAPEPVPMIPAQLPPHPKDTNSRNAGSYPIDLGSALALGGADNPQVKLVRERVYEACLDLEKARLAWLPSLRAGVGYNRHDGRLQATEGHLVDATRSSTFVGGGAGWGDTELTGGSSGPARLNVDLSLADLWFERLAALQDLGAAGAVRDATVNDILLDIAVAYYALLQSEGLLTNANAALAAADNMVDLTTKFAEQGQIARSEVARAIAARGLLQYEAEDARRRMVGGNAELVRLLRLDAPLVLIPAEADLIPVEFVDEAIPLEMLQDQGIASRPELRQYRHLVAAADERIQQEHWRPWLPHLVVGYGAGSFGGGPGGSYDRGGRGDLDAMAVWELQNLGLGNRTLSRKRESEKRQAHFQYWRIRDQVVAEVTTAEADVTSHRRQLSFLDASVVAAEDSYRLNLQRIHNGEGLPIELLQAIRARLESQDALTKTVARYNQAQFRLLRAVGQSPDDATL